MHKSSAQKCINFHVFHIDSGIFSDVDLAGSTFVLLNSPLTPGNAPSPQILFINTTDRKKASATSNSLRILFGLRPLKIVQTRIDFRAAGSSQQVSIPGILSYRVSSEQQRSLSPEVSDNLYPWLFNAKQGVVESVVYSPQGQGAVSYTKTNAIFGQFRIPSHER